MQIWMVGTAMMLGLGLGAWGVWRLVRGPRVKAALGVLSRRWLLQHGEEREP